MMNEAQVIMFKCVCAYGRISELRAIVVKNAWEIEELKILENWWQTLNQAQQAKIKNVMRRFATEAQFLAQRNLKDRRDA